jgi:AcrR family transcriptional regulator
VAPIAPTQSERVRKASQERRAQQKEDVRQAILAEASKLLQEAGYEGFSLRKLAERIGYSATTIYIYFKDKDDLLSVLIRERFERWIGPITAAMTEIKDPMERLSVIGRAYLDFGLSDPAFFRGVYLQRPDLLAQVIGPERLSIGGDVTERTLQEAIDAGQIAPCNVKDTANALWAASHGIVTLLVTLPKFTPEQAQGMIDACHSLILKGLR